ncbi:cell division protein SepF [Actinocatenispora rupis]|uniref:Cell division protein SepF n=1 Tax=Actinocatenispora rupis TaxID=519421 RepID=A0A8J3J4K2_9ACTN|nr:cell division protein SepF [Actinocatenispora rupis]GID09298.1 cell division protein SepF 2 [Actinocatenispora rupis]
MGALRKAGVWLGLVEDEEDGYDADDDRYETSGRYDGAGRQETTSRYEGTSRYDTRPHRRREPARDLDDADFDDAEYADDDFDAPEPARPRLATGADRQERTERASVRSLNRGASVTSLTQDNLALAPQVQLRERAVVSDESAHGYRITTVHPTTYNEARTIGEHFRDNTPVIMNLSEMDEADAMRLVDFAAGLIFGLRGTIERVTNRVFLLSPANVTVTAEDKAKIAEGGFFNQS